jgi:hypothetical protein
VEEFIPSPFSESEINRGFIPLNSKEILYRSKCTIKTYNGIILIVSFGIAAARYCSKFGEVLIDGKFINIINEDFDSWRDRVYQLTGVIIKNKYYLYVYRFNKRSANSCNKY